MGRLDTELLGLQIVALENAAIVGEIDGLIVDDQCLKIAGFLVDLGLFEARALPFEAALSLGDDAVVVEKAEAVRPITSEPKLENLARKEITISFARAITRSGRSMGTVGDFLVDTESGDIVGLEILPAIEGDDRIPEPMFVAASGVHKLGREVVVLVEDIDDHVIAAPARPSTAGDTFSMDDAPSGPSLLPGSEAEDQLDDTVTDIPAPDLAALPAAEEAATLDAAAEPPADEPSAEPAQAKEVPAEEVPAEREVAGGVATAEAGGVAAVDQAAPDASTDTPTDAEHPVPALMAVDTPAPEAGVGTEPTTDVGSEPAPSVDEQPRHFLLGKRVLRRIEDPDGSVIAEAGDAVSYEMIQHAKASDQLLILSLNVE